MMCCNRPVLKACRAVAVSYANFTVDKAEDRLQSLADRLRTIRHECLLDLQSMRLTRILMADALFELDAFAESVKSIAAQQLDVRPQAVASEAESIALKVERMLNPVFTDC